MGFKFNLQPKQKKPAQPTPTVSPISRRCGGEAVEIMEKYSKRIEEQVCKEDVKILLKKCLFKMVAAESVESEIGFLSEMRILLDKPMSQQALFLKEQTKDLGKLIREMYEIAIDKQIDQHYHKSSKHIDHLNVLDDRFRIYALSTISTCPDEIMRSMQNNYYFYHNYYDEEYTIRRGRENRTHYEIDDDEDEEDYDYEDTYQEEEYAYRNNYEFEDNLRDEQQQDDGVRQQEEREEHIRQSAGLDEVDDQSDLRESNSQIGQQGGGGRGQEESEQEEEKEIEQKDNENTDEDDDEDKDYESIFSHRTRWLNREVFNNLQWPRQFSSHRGQNKEEEDNSNEES